MDAFLDRGGLRVEWGGEVLYVGGVEVFEVQDLGLGVVELVDVY